MRPIQKIYYYNTVLYNKFKVLWAPSEIISFYIISFYAIMAPKSDPTKILPLCEFWCARQNVVIDD